MNVLADKVHKQEFSIIIMATLFNHHNNKYSSGTPVGTKFTATYVGMQARFSE